MRIVNGPPQRPGNGFPLGQRRQPRLVNSECAACRCGYADSELTVESVCPQSRRHARRQRRPRSRALPADLTRGVEGARVVGRVR